MSNKQKANIKLAETKALSTKYKSLDTILVERRDRVGLITLNRPKSLNALNIQ
jgi:enoyl-CoA hydratase